MLTFYETPRPRNKNIKEKEKKSRERVRIIKFYGLRVHHTRDTHAFENVKGERGMKRVEIETLRIQRARSHINIHVV